MSYKDNFDLEYYKHIQRLRKIKPVINLSGKRYIRSKSNQ